MLSTSDPLRIKIANIHQEEAVTLLQALTLELADRYGDDGGDNSFQVSEVEQENAAFILARWEQQAIGCGAIRPIVEGIAEIKRMYVAPFYRGKGIARMILQELEKLARDFGYQKVWLETGTEQPEAIRLYQSCGYRPIPPFGYYRDDPRSLCFEKVL